MKKLCSTLSFLLICSVNISAIDLPTNKRAIHFQGHFPKYPKDWTSSLNVRFSGGETHKGYDGRSHSTNILNINGLININSLAYNIEDLTATTKPTTYQYLRKVGGTIPSYAFEGNDGKLELHGKFATQEFEVELQQFLFWGFFARAYTPIRKVKINQIDYTNLTASTHSHAADFQSFLTNNLDTVLSENGLLPLATSFNKTSCGDLNISAGWQGRGENIFKYINALSGFGEFGVVIPVTPRKKSNLISAIPVCYDGIWGINARGLAEAHVNSWLNIGIYGNAIIFLNQDRNLRMITDKTQSGLIVLEKGYTHVDPGTLWNVSVYTKLTPVFKRFLITAGYSFTRQENTSLNVKDSTFLSTYITEQKNDASIIYKPTQNEIVNSDDRFKEWNQHTLHLQIGYDATLDSSSKYAPAAFLFYDLPFYGRRSFKTSMLGGDLGLTVKWDI